MADWKNGIQTGRDKPHYTDKERDQDEDEGVPSLSDCWELVGSGPGSPLPEARVDGSALEEAMAVACGGSLQDDYFACTHSLPELDVLSLSTELANRQSKEEGITCSKVDAFVSFDSETQVVECSRDVSFMLPTVKIDDYKEGIGSMHGGSHTHYDNFTLHQVDMHLDNRMCHHDNPYRMLLEEHSNVTDLERCKVNGANPGMSINEVMEHDDFSRIGYDNFDHDSLHLNEDNMQCMNQSLASVNGIQSVAICTNGHQLSTLPVSQESEPSSSLHGMHENLTDIHSAEDVVSPPAVGDNSRESSRQIKISSGMRGSLTNTHKGRHCKLLTCGSWVWTQLTRWQVQLGYAKTIWSVALAAAVMGILFLGRGWQRLQAQNHSLRSQLWAKEKRITQLMFQLMQTKEALAKTRRVPVICVKSALQIPQGHL